MLLTNLISLYLLSVTIAVVFCAAQIKTLNGSSYTKTALLLCFAVCFYILGYTMELNSSTPSQIIFWNRIQYIGIPFVSALWLTTGLMYIGHFTRYKKLLFAAIYTIPIITLILRFTNDYHHLYFASINYAEGFGRLFLVKKSGPWMYVQASHSATMIFISMGLFIFDTVKKAEKEAGKIVLIVAASVFAVMGLLLAQLNPFGFQVDYMALCLPITCVMMILAISRYDLLEAKSVARSKVFEASSDAILLISHQNRILDYNNSAKRLFEQIDIHLGNKDLSVLFEKVPSLLEGFKKTKLYIIKLRINGEERYYGITTEKIDDHNILRGWIKIIRDVTEIYQLNEKLKKQAMTDELSVLSNRRAFIKTGREWILKSEENSQTLHLLMMDLDYFKNVNDQYGHPAGDLVIRDFAQMLKSHFASECLIARLGGEEFAALLAGFNDDEILQMINSLLAEADQHVYSYFGNQFHVTVSIGVTKRQSGQTLENMMGNADKALYQSKDRGRNCVTVL
ncbi:MAG: diguanylate cyclase [Lachnospiraceae bacterium]|nr:diguanylate cyclase [Lachnospiraceae bacterium]